MKSNRGAVAADYAASAAYRDALPPLSSPENIRNFIACVAHGMAIRAIEGSMASRLLYAAQVATSVLAKLSTRSKPSA